MKKEETARQTAIQRHVELSGGIAMKTHGSAIQGSAWPDIIGGHDGKPFAVEVKCPGEEATRAQKAVLDMFANHGYITGVVENTQQFERLFRRANTVVH